MYLGRKALFVLGAALLWLCLDVPAIAANFKSYIPGVTMTQMKTTVDCAVEWPEQQFGLVYQGCHQLYGYIDFQRGAKTFRRLTLVARDLSNPQDIVARIMRKRIDQANGTFNQPEVVVEVRTTGSVDELKKISASVPASKSQINLEAYFYYVEVFMEGPVEFAGVTVEYSN
jgi:hypothetical protein